MTEPPAEPPEPVPSPVAAGEAEGPRRHPRRWFLAGAGAVVVAGGAGVGAAFLRDAPEPKPNPAPRALVLAAQAERALVADLDATTGGTASVRRVLAQARTDHAAHLRTITAALAQFDPAPRPGPARGTARDVAFLRAAEQRASRDAAQRAATLDGAAAVLLASIAACEASHAELLA